MRAMLTAIDTGPPREHGVGDQTRNDLAGFALSVPSPEKEDYELFVGHGHGASAIRVGELQEDPLTRFLLRYDEFETGGELTDGKGKRIKMGKDSEPLRSGKGRALNVKVAQTCLALHVSHQFTHFAATDGGKDHEDKMAEDGKYVPNPRVAYGVFEGPALSPCPGGQH